MECITSSSNIRYADITGKASPRIATSVGYAGSFVGGSTLLIDPTSGTWNAC
ncbi:MAG: hypothetical protein WCA92_08210 [Terriglobales bacterium]